MFNNLTTQDDLQKALRNSCKYGNIDEIKYLLFSHPHKELINLRHEQDWPLGIALEYGQLEVVQFLLTSPLLKTKIFLNENSSQHIMELVTSLKTKSNFEALKYVLTSTELKSTLNVHAGNDYLFRQCCIESYMHVLEYLIFDYKIRQNPEIMKNLQIYPKVAKMFSVRDFNDSLHNALDSKELIKRNKI